MVNQNYTGRFAPTPSGPLHFGSIVAALASYLDARHNAGRWLLRIEDIDTPRVRRGADRKIINALEILGLEWDGAVVYQGARLDRYERALAMLADTGLLYRCYCPRRVTKGKPYPGTCRSRSGREAKPHSLRVRTPDETTFFPDAIRGRLAGRRNGRARGRPSRTGAAAGAELPRTGAGPRPGARRETGNPGLGNLSLEN